ncbi:alpha-(1,6)-fucosyltransferase-like isoform X3 [Pomacea canaliculata]|uniref:alpha-(1,6)-fucosyltransferase-like isoform X3 n=1 Tax=Pomacea canaliculata TaxID=400727 RepID=UPI000D735AF8|nr:alpha-(1,6)-fucosyltransferase-like isoform X3 [Pomacea canaliculata]
MLHEATMCLLTAYATHRTLVLTTNGWRFAPSTWDTFMMPLSTCTANDTKDMDPRNQTSSARVVRLSSLIRSWNNSPAKFRPLAIPADLAKRLKTFHGDPPTWWVGQLVSFLLRPQPHLQQTIQTQGEKMGFKRPIVGIQVRRTDKVNAEGRYYSLEEYMKHVEEYYDLRQQHEDIKNADCLWPPMTRRSSRNFRKSEFCVIPEVQHHQGGGQPRIVVRQIRYTRDGLSAVLVDLHFLSMCDFVVCTYTSNATTMIRRRKVCVVLTLINVVVIFLVIVTHSFNRSVVEIQSGLQWTTDGSPSLPNVVTIQINISELINRCLQEGEIFQNNNLSFIQQCVKRAPSAITLPRLEQLGTHTNPGENQTKALYPLSTERETARRRVESTAREVFYFITAKMDTLSHGNFSLNEFTKQFINNTRTELEDYKRSLSNDLHQLSHVDEDDEWRVSESKQLGDLVQRRLLVLQNPQNCSKAKIVVCNLGRPYGFGSMLHEATMCLLTAYATHRTLVLTTNGWRFTPSTWDTFMMPLSTCTTNDTRDMDPKNQTASARVVQLKSLIGEWNSSPAKFRPRAIPADLAKRLKAFHGDPPAWWVGQLVSFLLRPQPHLQQTIQTQGVKMGFQRPIVGIQVRRTDKVNDEAVYHSLEEYMKHVEEYYDLRQQHEDIKERRLFVATDDPSVFPELQKKYPGYNISGVEGSADSASVKSRYTRDGLSAVLVDLHFLSMCDFVVCTYTSNVCRAVYELMQTRHGDASHKVYSLDSSVYYVTYYDIYYQRAVISHEARSAAEVSFQVGDLLHIHSYLYHLKERAVAGNLRNGSTFGMNSRTGKLGLFPSYKAVDEIVEENMGENI